MLLGASVRALAASVLKSRLARDRYPDLLLLDYFGDDDLAREPRVRFARGEAAGHLPRSTAGLGRAALALAAEGVTWRGLAFTGGLENRPGLLRRLARLAPIAGNHPAAVSAVRDPERLAACLEKGGLRHAGVSKNDVVPATGRWLLKRRRGAGGSGVRAAPAGERRRPGEYLQLFLEGAPGSIAFVADGSEARLLGAALDLGAAWRTAPSAGLRPNVVTEALAAPAFRYAGSIAGPVEALLPPEAMRTLARAASLIAARFALRGLNGLDYVLADRGPCVLEVNPRFTASMEILEELAGVSYFDRHLEALDGALPTEAKALPEAPASPPAWRAKGILYADRPVAAPDPERLVPLGVRDRPRRGEAFVPGQPLCTLIVSGTDADDCRRRLAEGAAEVRRLFLPAGPPWGV